MKDPVTDLRARLRAGDPYAGGSMAEHDAARIRARLRAVQEPSRRPVWIPAVAVASVAMVAAALWVRQPAVPATSAPEVPETRVAAAPEPLTPIVENDSEVAEPPGATLPSETTTFAAALPATLNAAAEEPALEPDAEPVVAPLPERAVAAVADPPATARNVRFTAPRGTRIIWTLDPNYDPELIRASRATNEQGADTR